MTASVIGLPARGGPGLCRQTDAVDQFVAQEADGFKAEDFSRQKVLCQWPLHYLGAEHPSSWLQVPAQWPCDGVTVSDSDRRSNTGLATVTQTQISDGRGPGSGWPPPARQQTPIST